MSLFASSTLTDELHIHKALLSNFFSKTFSMVAINM